MAAASVTRRLRSTSVGLASLAALLAAVAGGAAAPTASLQDDRLAVTPLAEIPARLDLVAATGARVTRIDVLWRDVAPSKPVQATNPADPAYDWQRTDTIMRGLKARGIRAVIADIFLSPSWAARTADPGAAPRPEELARFAGALAARYSGRYPDPLGGVLPEIRWIEPWNEPNIGRYFKPQCERRAGRLVPTSPAAYAEILRQAGVAIKAANPNALIVAGSAGPQGGRQRRCRTPNDSVGVQLLLDELRVRGVPFDVWSQHIYPIGAPQIAPFFPSFRTLGRLEAELARIRPEIPIFVDETGYHSSYSRAHRYFVSERQQAGWLQATWEVAAKHPQVALVTWFNLQDNPDWTGGLLRANESRKPSHAAFVAITQRFPPGPEWTP